MRMPMNKLDGIVIREVTKRVLEPQRMSEMLEQYVSIASEREQGNKGRLAKLRRDQTEAEAGIRRLLELVEKGLMHAKDPDLKDRLVNQKLRRDEAVQEIADLQKRMSAGERQITPEKVTRVAALLRDKPHDGPPQLRQAYVRLFLEEVSVSDQEMRISGSKDILAKSVSNGLDSSTPMVLSFLREWRARHNSNVRPLPSEPARGVFSTASDYRRLYDILLF